MTTTIPAPPGTDAGFEPDPGPWCPTPVRQAAAAHRWDDLTFLHWSYEPAEVQRLLPAGLTVETHGGRAWVGLVPFRMSATVGDLPLAGRRMAPVPPWIGRFAETNVRTYVRGPDGGTGVWFLSLDAARLGPVIVARRRFGLPYHWSAMTVTEAVSPAGRLVVSYRSARRWPGPPAASRVVVEVGERLTSDRLGPLDHWLTARWSLYRTTGGSLRGPNAEVGLRSMAAEHPPWALHGARLVELDDSLVAASGLTPPTGEPLVHWSPGVAVRISPRD